MALTKYGGGITQMSGSVAGTTFARNRFGNYARSRTKPTNPRSGRQEVARATVMFLAEQWHDSPMTDAKRLAWETYASSINWKNRLGESNKLTGFNHFLRSNAERIICGLSLISSGPTVLELAETDNTVVVTASAASQLISVAFNNALPWGNETGGAMTIHMGCPQASTRNFFNGPFRWIGKILGVTGTPPTTPKTIAPAWTLILGQKIWCKVGIVRADGRASNMWLPTPFIVGT
jgi:hypothetical protein